MQTFQSGIAVTKHDTNLNQYDALYVGGAGDVAINPRGSNTTVVFTVPAGTYIWLATDLVLSAGTTATNIIGLR